MLDQYKYSALKEKLEYHGLDQATLHGSKWRYQDRPLVRFWGFRADLVIVRADLVIVRDDFVIVRADFGSVANT